ncbi:hypothetical protein PVK06_007286 [Gossypium arboreum]|uniref:Nudix hydrolase domain-containing protein n=1 Tax=Gossypium arboreum TaxID=29729 RepID=A0ABR0QGX1_GOSAR|nr:hypothetical protein PVK06_007286 [Gossypium arboreum]
MSISWNPYFNNAEKIIEPWLLHEFTEDFYGEELRLVIVVGCLIEHDRKILLCKRNIEPSFGLWTLPAGYLEIGESAAEGAIRETWEEAGAEVEVISPFAQLDIPLIGQQTYVIFLAKLKKPQFSPGLESSEYCLFELNDIPFDSLAFSSIFVTLNLVKKRMKKPLYVYYQLYNFYQNRQRCGRGFNFFKLEKPRLSTSSSGTLFNVAFHGHSS